MKQLITCRSCLITVTILFSLFCLHCRANEIIDIEDGLTLAQINRGREANTLAVLEDDGQRIKAVNISELSGTVGDIPSTYQYLGYKKIVDIVSASKLSSVFSYSELVSPAGTGQHHIALGFNYPKHADEIDEEHQPFIYLKTIKATRQQDIQTNGSILLDYEIEICARPLQQIQQHDDVKTIPFGFFLCGDFTDRAHLMRNIDLDNMRSGAGFSEAKSLDGYFPTGPYLVVPKDKNSFLENVSFTLYRNGVLKQQAVPSEALWSIQTIVEEIFKANNSNRPTYSPGSDEWLRKDTIFTDMAILTGTPEGVIMKPPSLWYKIFNGVQWLLSGAIFNTSAQKYVIENYIRALQLKKKFLQPGEQLILTGLFMGQLDLSVRQGINF